MSPLKEKYKFKGSEEQLKSLGYRLVNDSSVKALKKELEELEDE